MLRRRTLRAARLARQSGKRLGGPSPGQVTDLAGAVPTFPERRFPAPSSGSPSSMFPAGNPEVTKWY